MPAYTALLDSVAAKLKAAHESIDVVKAIRVLVYNRPKDAAESAMIVWLQDNC
jgi:hypothetical protein